MKNGCTVYQYSSYSKGLYTCNPAFYALTIKTGLNVQLSGANKAFAKTLEIYKNSLTLAFTPHCFLIVPPIEILFLTFILQPKLTFMSVHEHRPNVLCLNSPN